MHVSCERPDPCLHPPAEVLFNLLSPLHLFVFSEFKASARPSHSGRCYNPPPHHHPLSSLAVGEPAAASSCDLQLLAERCCINPGSHPGPALGPALVPARVLPWVPPWVLAWPRPGSSLGPALAPPWFPPWFWSGYRPGSCLGFGQDPGLVPPWFRLGSRPGPRHPVKCGWRS